MATAGIAGRRGFFGVAATSSGTSTRVGEIRDFEVNPTMSPIDATSNDSSGWEEIIQGNRAWTMTAEAIYLSANASQVLIRETLSSGATRHFTIRPTTGGTALWRGTGFVTSYNVRGTQDGVQLTNVQIKGTRAFVYTT